MLKAAILFKDKIEEEFTKLWYSEKLFFYQGYSECGIHTIGDKSGLTKYEYAIVNHNNELIGFFTYSLDYPTKCIERFGLIHFTDSDHYTFMKDVINKISEVYKTGNWNRIEFYCVGDNPAEKIYDKMMKYVIIRD